MEERAKYRVDRPSKRDESGDSLYIDAHAMRANAAGFEAVGIAMDLISCVWWPTKQPFSYDPTRLAESLGKALPARGYTPDALERNAAEVESFFVVLPDGTWAPSPQYFSIANGNPGRAS